MENDEAAKKCNCTTCSLQLNWKKQFSSSLFIFLRTPTSLSAKHNFQIKFYNLYGNKTSKLDPQLHQIYFKAKRIECFDKTVCRNFQAAAGQPLGNSC